MTRGQSPGPGQENVIDDGETKKPHDAVPRWDDGSGWDDGEDASLEEG